ncbi:hypothetical protein [Microbacterium sp. IEGM 1404]|uniref:hypothetical protein n=1 Tax=Microbacterium sp. IEGM 1404 TaxID=3047084 RepID=UPI0024B74972|nr:hypothetical protein [Microbacterium sp. IEGM 1404]MDI9889940.1 hypothetical protein [Microbacterium sp. IEGM 1404]
MSAHVSAARDAAEGTVVLTCNADPCDRRFNALSFNAATTRTLAAANGWRPARAGDRQDFCPDHAGGKP